MSLKELSDEFDVLLNSHAVKAGFGEQSSPSALVLDEYEKSVLLTDAQEELVLSLYNGRNPSTLSFEETEELRRYLSELIAEATLEPLTNTSGTPLGVDTKSSFFTLPEDVWFITYEEVQANKDTEKCSGIKGMEVVPVRQDEYHRLKKNPFRGATERRALRLDLSEGNVEIVCKYAVTSYYLRYLKKLSPIILIDLPDGLAIRGVSEATTEEQLKVTEKLHRRILNRAVERAIVRNGSPARRE